MGFRRQLGEDGKPLESFDELPPWRQLIPLGIQLVLALYAGAMAVPLVVGGALIAAGKLDPDDPGWPTGCARTACPPFSAASSTPSRTRPSRRTSAWCPSPGSAAGTRPPSPVGFSSCSG